MLRILYFYILISTFYIDTVISTEAERSYSFGIRNAECGINGGETKFRILILHFVNVIPTKAERFFKIPRLRSE